MASRAGFFLELFFDLEDGGESVQLSSVQAFTTVL
jgi:hypothetical protein